MTKKVVVVGNCQARPIATLLEKMSDEIEVTKVAIVHLLKSEQENEYKTFFEEADYIIAQLVAPNYPCEFVRTDVLESYYGHKLTKIVNLFCYADTPYLRNLPNNLRGVEAPFADYHFPTVLECWENGADINTAALELDNQGNKSLGQIVSYDELETREVQANVTIVDYMKSAKQRLFHTFNHPRNDLLLEYSKRILKHLEVKSLPLDKKPTGAFLGQFVPFIKTGENCEHKLTKNKKVEFKTTQQLVADFYGFYETYLKKLSENYEGVYVPKTIVQYWDGLLPNDIKGLTETWKNNNPDFEYKLFNHKQALEFINKHYGEKEATLFLKAKLPAMQSDIFRVAYCLRSGGIYIDAASSCNTSISSFHKSNNGLTVMRKWHGGIWNGFIMSEPGNSTLKYIWSAIVSNVENETSNDVWQLTGPGLFNKYCEGVQSINIIKQAKMKEIFSLVNNLKHKKNNHWSAMQKEVSVFSALSDEAIKSIPKVIVHLGPHKTGTTSFQNILEVNEEKLKENNITPITVRSKCSPEYKKLRVKYTMTLQGALLSKSLDENAVIEQLATTLQEMVAIVSDVNTKLVLLCDENLLGPPTGHYFAGDKGRELGFYSLNNMIFKAIQLAFGEQLEKVMITDRGYNSFLSSSYKHFISKLTVARTFDEFNSDLNESFVQQYQEFFSVADKVFGEKLQRANFSDFCKKMPDYIADITKIDVNDLVIKESKSNASLNERGIEMALKLIPLLETDSERLHFRRFLMKLN